MDQRVANFVQVFQMSMERLNNLGVLELFQSTVDGLYEFDVEEKGHRLSYLRRGRVIVAFKDRGGFKEAADSAKFLEAYQQLTERYIPGQAQRDHLTPEEYIGVAFDGESLAFVFTEPNGVARHTDLVPLNEHVVEVLFRFLDGNQRSAFSGPKLIADFGPNSKIAIGLVKSLARKLAQDLDPETGSSKVQMLYAEWKKLFEQVASVGSDGQEKLARYLQGLGFAQPEDLTQVLFVLHTYNSIIFKLLAAELVTSLRKRVNSGVVLSFLELSNDDLQNQLRDQIENSRLFKDQGIRNFIEGQFFTWYLDGECSEVLKGVRQVCKQLNFYLFPLQNSETIRDAIKHFYEGIVPEVLRKNIGEYYTPEWLVEFTLDQVGYRGAQILDCKILDPTCGSGNFVIHALQRYKREGRLAGWKDDQLLHSLLTKVVGFDLNPLAVLASRLNYLLNISDLLTDVTQKIEIPIFLADAVYSPTKESGQQIREYKIGTLQGDLEIELPDELIESNTLLGEVFDLMEMHIETESRVDAFIHDLFKNPWVQRNNRVVTEAIPYLTKIYRQVLALELKNWNGIWCRMIRNYFASVAIGECDYIVGNPPWVRWSDLPAGYRERIKPTCDSYQIFSETPYFGGNELDISAMIAYTVVDKWLKNQGKMSFVIPQVHFQGPSSQGFRKLRLPDGTPLGMRVVHDLAELKPFPKVSNRPAVFIWEKGIWLDPPYNYLVWRGSRTLQPWEKWEEVKDVLAYEELIATPIPPDQRWSILPAGQMALLEKLKGGSKLYQGRKGITTDLNGAYFVQVLGYNPETKSFTVKNLAKSKISRKPVIERVFEVEEDLLFPLLKGAKDFRAFQRNQLQYAAIVPNRSISSFLSEEEFNWQYAQAYRYFVYMNRETKGLLEKRSTYRTRMPGAPFYAIYNVGDYTFAPYKVVWAEMAAKIQAAVFSTDKLPGGVEKVVIPDHKVYFLPCADELEAFYVCGMLNSAVVSTFINSFTVKLQVGTIFKHLNLPPYDLENPLHLELAALSKEAHAELTEDRLQKIDRLAEGIIAVC